MTAHAIQRARERYGMVLNHRDIAAIAALLKPDNRLQRRQDHVSGIHAVTYQGRTLVVVAVYRSDPPVVATLLDPDYFSAAYRKRHRALRAKAARTAHRRQEA